MSVRLRDLPVVIQILVKYPHPGAVKTRLIDTLGVQGATDLYRWLVERQLQEFSRLPGRIQLELWCTEDADAHYYRALFKRWPRLRYRRQSDGDLGERMDHALYAGMRHACCVIQTGADCPVLCNPHIIRTVNSLLSGADAVFIPAEDGGYVLGAYTSYQRTLFDSIDWSTERVMQQTLARLERLGIHVVMLDCLWDLDRPADYFRLQRINSEVVKV